jgi:hypothetical protein
LSMQHEPAGRRGIVTGEFSTKRPPKKLNRSEKRNIRQCKKT